MYNIIWASLVAALIALLETADAVEHLAQADGVGIEHRPAAIGREAVAREVHHVDVGGAQRDAFLQDARALVDERVDAALDDLVIRDLARLHLDLLAIVDQELFHLGVRNGLAAAFLVAVPAASRFLPVPALLANEVGELRVHHVGALGGAALADLPADVVARH